MNIQIIGTKKCRNTRKAERYFKERAISYHFVDLAARSLSKGELAKIKSAVGLKNLIDSQGKEYDQCNMKYIIQGREEMLLTHPLLFKTPIVRNGSRVTVGYCPETWDGWRQMD